jgi:hypothetical protein
MKLFRVFYHQLFRTDTVTSNNSGLIVAKQRDREREKRKPPNLNT